MQLIVLSLFVLLSTVAFAGSSRESSLEGTDLELYHQHRQIFVVAEQDKTNVMGSRLAHPSKGLQHHDVYDVLGQPKKKLGVFSRINSLIDNENIDDSI